EPLDSTQFVEQLATFSGLEQQIASNSHLESIVSLLQSNMGLGGDLIGQNIATPAITAEGPFDPVVISAPNVTEGALIVRNSSGDEIFRGPGGSEWSWDGRDAEGNAVALDTFTFEIATPDGDVPANALGQIDRVIATAGGQAVGLGGNVVTSVYTVL
ncbi:MAG: flagellar hook capping FlgD N-terminal domain-containing protein, partial [Pseudomonadota bacterium]